MLADIHWSVVGQPVCFSLGGQRNRKFGKGFQDSAGDGDGFGPHRCGERN